MEAGRARARDRWLVVRGRAVRLGTRRASHRYPSGPRTTPPPPSSTPLGTRLDTSVEFDGFVASVEAWDLDAAERRRAGLTDARERELAAGISGVYAAEYAEAESTLAALIAARPDADANDMIVGRARHYLDLARGAQLALGDAIVLAQ